MLLLCFLKFFIWVNAMTLLMPTMTPQEFVTKWDGADFGEKQASQEMFLDICGLVGHATPVAYGNREVFTFEKHVLGNSADAYLENHFVWEFKGRDRQLDDALRQAKNYAQGLKYPPLIIASSFETIRIETAFQGMEQITHTIALPELVQPPKLEVLRDVFHNPTALRPQRTVEDVTQETAKLFSQIVSHMEGQSPDPGALAIHFNRLMFCLYAEDVGLLPDGLFTSILYDNRERHDLSNMAIASLFEQMANGGLFGHHEISHFNGDLYRGEPPIELNRGAMQCLGEAVKANWRSIDPSIFGTLFERVLDASKRAQTGTHYTGSDDIKLVVEPVMMTPLCREWDATRDDVQYLLNEGDRDGAFARLEGFRRRLAAVTVLDPACGSGNFLYIALRSLLDLEREVINFAAVQGWHGLTPTVQPDQMLGLEINHYAAELARTALWIGYIQWHQGNGFAYTQRPILTPLDTIRQTDAILDLTNPDHPAEPVWPAAEFIVGNPPFLGSKLIRTGLSDEYVEALFERYKNRVPGESDLVCYWFDQAQRAIRTGKTKRAGLLATQGIRGGASRRVLQHIKESGDIFMAWSDHPWVLEGAAVHISIVGFDDGSETTRELDGQPVEFINANLTTGADLTAAKRLGENAGVAFMGDTKGGPFDIPDALAREMLQQPNPHGKSNEEVVRPWVNGQDITGRPRGMWIVDFGNMSLEQAALFEAPFEYVNAKVRPQRAKSRSTISNWWLHERPRPEMRQALSGLKRFIVTPTTSKFRLFSWLDETVLAHNALIAIASDGYYTFGVLHSRCHELWARGMGTQLREVESGFRYTPTTCFETFPFPRPAEEQREAVGAAAAELNSRREGWLNPPGISAAELRKRTLTNLYNQRPTWLDNIHARLDAAVAEAYGWPADLADTEILERLLALNLERAEAETNSE